MHNNNYSNNVYYKKNGFSLVEVLISIVIISIAFSSTLFFAQNAFYATNSSGNFTLALEIINSQAEAIRQLRSQSWDNLIPGSYYAIYNSVSNPPNQIQGWELIAGTGVIGNMSIEDTISVPYRADSNTLTTTGTTADTNMRIIQITASWTQNGVNYSKTEYEYLSDWKPF